MIRLVGHFPFFIAFPAVVHVFPLVLAAMLQGDLIKLVHSMCYLEMPPRKLTVGQTVTDRDIRPAVSLSVRPGYEQAASAGWGRCPWYQQNVPFGLFLYGIQGSDAFRPQEGYSVRSADL